MATTVYQWNPFQEVLVNNIPREIIKASANDARREFVPRNAPFFSRGVKLYLQGSSTPLVAGEDYVFAHPFAKFTSKYSRNAYGSVVLLKEINSVLEMDYSTIGGPFVLDDSAMAALVANIVNSPHTSDWDTLANIPADFPTDPHDHPAVQTYDYEEMMTSLTSLVAGMIGGNQTSIDVNSLLEEHLNSPLIKAHLATKADIGLDLTPNMPAAQASDLDGDSSSKLVTISVLKTAIRQLLEGTLVIGPTSEEPQPPTSLRVSESSSLGNTVYTITIRGGAGADGKPVTYNLSQEGSVTVVFSKSTLIGENEQVTFVGPTITNDTSIVISAYTVDSIGVISSPISSVVLLKSTGDSDEQIIYFMGQF